MKEICYRLKQSSTLARNATDNNDENVDNDVDVDDVYCLVLNNLIQQIITTT